MNRAAPLPPPRLVGRFGLIGLLACASLTAGAQELDVDSDAPSAGEATSEDAPDVAPALKPAVQADWADDHTWVDQGFPGVAVDVAVTRGGTVLAMDTTGVVYVRLRPGRWVRGLGATRDLYVDDDNLDIDDEDLLLDVEATVGELREGAEDDGFNDDADVDPAEGLDDAVTSSIQLSEQFLGVDLVKGATHVLWADPFEDGLVIAAHGGQAWRSVDGGESWEDVETLEDATAIVRLRPDEPHLVAATRSGVRHSLDGGRSWITVDDDISGILVHSVAAVGGDIFAGTSVGLFVSTDALRWSRMYPPELADQAVTTVSADPWWDDGLWVAGEEGIYRSDDRGETFRWAGRNPLVGTRIVVTLDRTGHLLAAGDDGVWESGDGGVRWQPLAMGLSGPNVSDMSIGPSEGVWLVGEGSVFHLERASTLGTLGAADLGPGERIPEVGLVLDWSLGRAGVDYSPLRVQRSIIRSLTSPRLRFTGRLTQQRTLASDFDAIQSTRDNSTRWVILTDLCFGGCGGTSGTTDVAVDDMAAFDGSDLTVIGGQVYESDSTEAMASAGANVSERMARYRNSLASTVAELYFSRVNLVDLLADTGNLPLREQVDRRLDIAEITARLDVFTDGSFSRYLDAGPEPTD